ncbi:hypothetical protein [Blautia sp. XA-2221]|uniref:hypothetical protein n=1 Tax=Blautia sp. XA-2221 TaxID=2903961 RepID=UPI0023798822|nr:hypothetical protein [Blautia sp. XA-2221]
MIKRIWTWWRIISVIILPMVIFLFAGGLLRSLSSDDLVIILFFVVTLIFLIHVFMACAFPKRFECMRIVKKYLSFKELKSYIKKEQFSKFEFKDKSDSFSLYYSENWLFVSDVYIPRKMILDMVSFKREWYSSYADIGIVTKNGDYVTIAKVNSDIQKIAVDSLLKNFPEFKNSVEVLKNVLRKSFYKTLKAEFEKEVTTKKDFITYIG